MKFFYSFLLLLTVSYLTSGQSLSVYDDVPSESSGEYFDAIFEISFNMSTMYGTLYLDVSEKGGVQSMQILSDYDFDDSDVYPPESQLSYKNGGSNTITSDYWLASAWNQGYDGYETLKMKIRVYPNQSGNIWLYFRATYINGSTEIRTPTYGYTDQQGWYCFASYTVNSPVQITNLKIASIEVNNGDPIYINESVKIEATIEETNDVDAGEAYVYYLVNGMEIDYTDDVTDYIYALGEDTKYENHVFTKLGANEVTVEINKNKEIPETDYSDNIKTVNVNVLYKNQVPTISIISGPGNGETVDYNDVTFTWSGSDADGTVTGYEYMMDDIGYSSAYTSETFNNLSEGDHTFKVRCIDNDGAYSDWDEVTFTVERNTVDLDVGVNNVSGGDASLPGENAIVYLYKSDGTKYDNDRTNTSAIAEFRDVPAANNYSLKVYHDPVPETEFGDEYWGSRADLDLLGSSSESFQRNLPYIADYDIKDVSGKSVKHDYLTAGSIATLEILVKNPNTSTSYQVEPLAFLDRSKASSYDFTLSRETATVSPGATVTLSYPITPTVTGNYYIAVSTKTYTEGSWRVTDGWYWDENPTLTVEQNTVDLDVGVNNVSGGNASLPGENAIVYLYESDGSEYDHDRTNTSAIAEFRDVPAANNYSLKVYHDPVPDTEFGDEYWGSRADLDLLGSSSESFQRNLPYIADYDIKNASGQSVKHDFITAGSSATVEILVKNPNTSTSFLVEPLAYLDRSKTSSYDFTLSGKTTTVSPGATATLSYPITPTVTGDYYIAVSTETYVESFWQVTDGWYWDENPTLSIKNDFPPIDIPILMYHNIDDVSKSQYWLALNDFEAQMNALASLGYNPVSLNDIFAYVQFGTPLPDNPVVLTFDDGYQNFYTKAYPVLKEYGFKANSFLITDYIVENESERMVNSWDVDPIESSFNNPHLIWPEVIEMDQNGITFGSHSKSHPHLTNLSLTELQTEIVDSKTLIASKLGRCDFFSYPYGDLNETVVNAVKNADYLAAVDIIGDPVYNTLNSDLFRMERINIPADMDINTFSQKINSNLEFPKIIIESVIIKDEFGNPKTSFNKGENVIIEVNIRNDGAAVTTVASLNLDGDNDSSTPPMYDSRLTNPVEDKTIAIAGGGAQKTIQFEWQVPQETDVSQWYYDIGFHGEHYVLWHGGTGWTTAFNVNLGIVKEWTRINKDGIEYIIKARLTEDLNIEERILIDYCDFDFELAVYYVNNEEENLVTDKELRSLILTLAANKVILNSLPNIPDGSNSITSTEIQSRIQAIDKDGDIYMLNSLVELSSSDEQKIRDTSPFNTEGTDYYKRRYDMYSEVIRSIVYFLNEDQIMSFHANYYNVLEKIDAIIEVGGFTEGTLGLVKNFMMNQFEHMPSQQIANSIGTFKNIDATQNVLGKIGLVYNIFESVYTLADNQKKAMIHYMFMSEIVGQKIEIMYNAILETEGALRDPALINAMKDVRYDFHVRYNAYENGDWTELLKYMKTDKNAANYDSFKSIAIQWGVFFAEKSATWVYLAIAPWKAGFALWNARDHYRCSILSTNLHEILINSIENRPTDLNSSPSIVEYGIANNIRYISAYIAYTYMLEYLRSPLVNVGSWLHFASLAEAKEYYKNEAEEVLQYANSSGGPWYFAGISGDYYDQKCLEAKLINNNINPEHISSPTLVASEEEIITGDLVMLSCFGSVSNYYSLLEYQFDYGNGNQSDWGNSTTKYSYSDAGSFDVRVKARSQSDSQVESNWSNIVTIGVNPVEEVSVPYLVDVPSEVNVDETFSISASGAISNLGNPVEYQFSWDDGYSDWGVSTGTHKYNYASVFYVNVRARSTTNNNVVSDWSNLSQVEVVYPVEITSISIGGPNEVFQNSTANYSCIANYSDGSTKNISNLVYWTINSVSAAINENGELTAYGVSADEPCTISATFGDFSDSYDVTIINTIPLPAVTISLTSVTSSTCFQATDGSITVDYTVTPAGTVLDRGIYYGTDPDPVANGTKISQGTGSGDFSCTIDGLGAGTYYACTYAENEAGIAFSSTQQVVLSEPDAIGIEFNSYAQETSANFEIFVSGGTPLYQYKVTACDENNNCTDNGWQQNNTYVLNNLQPSTNYNVEILVQDANGCEENVTTNLTTLPVALEAPVATEPTIILSNGFVATWEPVQNAFGYLLDIAHDEQFTNCLSDYQNKDVGNFTSSTIPSLEPSTTYYYRVRAVDEDINFSAYSNIISVTTLSLSPPDAPDNFSAVSLSQTSIKIIWDTVMDATGYYLDISTDASFTSFVTYYENKDLGNVISETVINLTPNTTYYCRLRAYNDGGKSDNSEIISITTDQVDPPASPLANAASGVSETRFTANWDISLGTSGYYLDVAADEAFTNFVSGYENKDVGDVTTEVVTGLTANTTYHYRVRAYNAGGTSDNSNIIQVKTLQGPVCNLSISETSLGFTKSGGVKIFSISSNSNWIIDYDFPATLEFSSTSGEVGDEISISVTTSENTSANSLTGTITVSNDCGVEKTISISQPGTTATPSILTDIATINFYDVLINTESNTESYTLTGSNLTSNITVTPSDGFLISKSSNSGYTSNSLIFEQLEGSVDATVYVKFSPTEIKTYLGKIVHSSTGATSINIEVTGTGIEESCTPPPVPTGVAASNGTNCDEVQITWNSVTGATSYNVYRGDTKIATNLTGTSYDDLDASVTAQYYSVTAVGDCESEKSAGDPGYKMQCEESNDFYVSDLRVVPTVVNPGEQFTLYYKLSYSGTSETPLQTTYKVYYGTSPNVENATNILASGYSDLSKYITFDEDTITKTISESSTDTEVYFFVVTDDGEAFKEINETNNTQSVKLVINQQSTPYLNVDLANVTLPSTQGGSKTINISSNVDWTVTTATDWLNVSPATGSGDGPFTVTTSKENYNTTSRSGIVTISGNGINNMEISITQEGGPLVHDFYISNPQILNEEKILPGAYIELECTQNYEGNGANIMNSRIGYFLSVNEKRDAQDILLGEDISTLSGSTTNENKNRILRIPDETTQGNYYILFVADYPNEHQEVDENNNVSASQITIETPVNSVRYVLPTVRIYPNPFNDVLNIEFGNELNEVDICIYDVLGRKIKRLNKNSGLSKIIAHWDGTDDLGNRVNTGLYFIHILMGEQSEIYKVSFIER